MASGHRKRKAASLRIEVLNPAGLTNLPESERGNTSNLNNLINISNYASGGVSPTFVPAATGLLSDAVSNADGTYTKAGLTGETTNAGKFVGNTMAGAIGHTAAAKHYYFPAIGNQTVLSGSSFVMPPVIVYSNEGPQSKYVSRYLGGTTITSSIIFGAQITGANNPSHVVVYVGGELTTNDQIRIRKPTDGTLFTAKILTGSDTSIPGSGITTSTSASAAELSANLYRKAFLITASAVNTAQGMIIEFSSSANTSTTPVGGVFIAISSGTY